MEQCSVYCVIIIVLLLHSYAKTLKEEVTFFSFLFFSFSQLNLNKLKLLPKQ